MSFRSKGAGRTLLPFGLDYGDVLATNLEVEKPKVILPVNAPLSDKEKDQALQSIHFAKVVLDGPFYTGNSALQQQNSSSTLDDGIERHTDKYKKLKKIGATIEDHPYNLDFFPQELYPVMGVSKKKKLGISSYQSSGDLNVPLYVNEADEKSKLVLEQLRDMADDLDSKDEVVEEDVEEEDIEDEFEDDEDDDYNAEKYFDDGNDDYADNGDEEAAF